MAKKRTELVRYLSPFASPAWMSEERARIFLESDDAVYLKLQRRGLLSLTETEAGPPRIERRSKPDRKDRDMYKPKSKLQQLVEDARAAGLDVQQAGGTTRIRRYSRHENPDARRVMCELVIAENGWAQDTCIDIRVRKSFRCVAAMRARLYLPE